MLAQKHSWPLADVSVATGDCAITKKQATFLWGIIVPIDGPSITHMMPLTNARVVFPHQNHWIVCCNPHFCQ